MLKVNIEEKIDLINIEDLITESEIKYGDKYEKPEPLLVILDGVNERYYKNYGGLSAVFGKQKARKTFELVCEMSAAVGNCIIDDKLRAYTYGKTHLWFDTEQTRYYTNLIVKRIVKKLGLNSHPENLRVFSIKRYCTEDRVKVIEYVISKTANIGLVVIDGIRDLVKNFNNLDECTDIINKIMSWQDIYKCHITVVLHINPLQKGDEEKPRGHLGTEIQNKAESTIIIEKSKLDKSVSIIKPRDFRDKDVNVIGLRIDDHGIPVLFNIKEDEQNEFM